MQTYVTNKLLSFLGVFTCIAVTYFFFGDTTKQWQAILISIVVFGYGHFLLGFYYQLRGFLRKPDAWKYFCTFGFLTLFSIVFSYVLFYYAGFVAALFLGFLYFLFHGLLNEQTLISRQTGHMVPLLYLAALAIFVIALLTYSIPDKTFFFDRYLQFADLNNFWVTYIFERYYLSLERFTQVFWIGFVLSLITLGVAWIKYRLTKLALFLLVVLTVITGVVFVFGQPAYIYMYLFVVGYHFMTWLLFYIVEMKKRGRVPFRNFLIHNTLVLLPFLVGAYYFFQPEPPAFTQVLFDYQLYITATYVHISTSFLNDEWMVQLQNRFFSFFGW